MPAAMLHYVTIMSYGHVTSSVMWPFNSA